MSDKILNYFNLHNLYLIITFNQNKVSVNTSTERTLRCLNTNQEL